MVNISKFGDSAIKFTFTDNDHYLFNGEIEVPINSLLLVLDESDMATFKKIDGDPFVSFLISNSNFASKSDLENFYIANMVGSGNSESGITSGDVESMIEASLQDYYDIDEIDAALSGKADSSAVTEAITAAVSGKADTSAITTSITSASTDTQVPSAKAVYDALQESGGGGVSESAFTSYSAATDARISEDEEVTAAALNALNDGKQDTLIAGSGITISGNVISAEGGNLVIELTQAEYDALVDKDPNAFYIITDATAVDLSNYYTKSETSGATQISTALASKQDTLVSGTNIKTINNESILGSGNITIEGGGGGKAVSGGTNISITTGETADTINCTLPISSIQGYNGIIVGKSSYGNGYRHIVGGLGCNAKAKTNSYTPDDCLVIGQYLNVHNSAEVAFGQYNTTVQNTLAGGQSGTTAFSIGNGINNLTRHNAFEIRQNGDIYIADTNDTSTSNYYEKPMIKLQDALGGGGDVTVDPSLDSGSTNPVANSAIYDKFDEVEEVTAAALNALNDNFDGLRLKKLTQAEYEALTVKDNNTLYILVG